MARLLGLGDNSSQTVSNIERGVAKIPRKYLDKFSELTGLPREHIVGKMLIDERNRLCGTGELDD